MIVEKIYFGEPQFEKFFLLDLKVDSFYQLKDRQQILFELSPDRKFFTHGKGQAFVCTVGATVVGRIYVSTDSYIESPEKIAMFGYFDCINNQSVAHLLLGAALEWAKEEGCAEMHGPIDLNIYNGYRLQTKGFSKTPFLGEPRSMEYYQHLITSFGFEEAARWNSWDISGIWRPLFYLSTEIDILKLKLKGKLSKLKAIPFNQKSIETEFEKLYPLIMTAFKKNYLFTRVDLEEYKEYFLSLAKLLDETSSYVVDESGDVQGFTFTFPNISTQSIRDRALVLHTVCISEGYRKSGLVYILGRHINNSIKFRYTGFIGALAKEGKTVYDKIGPPTRTYKTFKKNIR